MAEVTRFPYYHQAENVVTNHVMVMLRTMYDSSPKLLQNLLASLCGEEVTVGPQFSQQIYGSHSIPDGLILQEPLAVFVETKLGQAIDAGQLERHCASIVDRLPGRKGCYLIALTSGAVKHSVPNQIVALEQRNNIRILSVTFRELLDQLLELKITDLNLSTIRSEFEVFLNAYDLLPRNNQKMLAVLAGKSWRENVEYGVYFEPFDRNGKWKAAAFIGMYHDRCVSHVGRIVAAVGAEEDENGKIIYDKPEMGTLEDKMLEAIRGIIDAVQGYYPDFQGRKHRYYITDGLYQTEFTKSSRGGMMGNRYFDIEEISGIRLASLATGQEAAKALDGKSFT
jgi:hypothetical protein